VQLFWASDQGDLKRAYQKAVDFGYPRKAEAIKSFLVEEVKDGKRPERNIDGKGADRFARHKERVPRPTTAKS
jgi:hypothetical protein